MSVSVEKRNGEIYNVFISGDEVKPLLDLLFFLWNESSLASTNVHFLKGIEALHMIMKEYR